MEIENKTKKKKKHSLIIFLLVIIIVLSVVLYNNLFREPRTAKMVVSSILTDEKVISQLESLVVPYGGIYEEKNDKGKNIREIAYKGTVTYGLDFSKIDISESSEEKVIVVKIPEVTLDDIYIDPISLSSIPEGKTTELAGRIQNCRNDLKEKFNSNTEMYELAEISVKDTLSNFLRPIIDSLDTEYKLVIE